LEHKLSREIVFVPSALEHWNIQPLRVWDVVSPLMLFHVPTPPLGGWNGTWNKVVGPHEKVMSSKNPIQEMPREARNSRLTTGL
jgi:hypothetical protein